MDGGSPSPIGPERADLMALPVSIIVGTRDEALQPHLMRAVGARLSPDRRRLRLLLPVAGSDEVLGDIRANAQVAVVFSQPSSHRTLQVKGSDAGVVAADAEDLELAQRYLEGFVAEIGQLGFPAEVAHTLIGHDEHLVAIEFTVAEAFEQTPGPSAGDRLSAAPA